MRPGRLIALAVVVAALGVYIGFFERHQPTTDQRKEQVGKLFPGFDQTKATKITVTNTHGRFVLVKQGASWALTAPLADQANQGAVSNVLFSLAGLKAERTFPAGAVKLADYGLVKPPLAVTVETAARKSYGLQLGDELPLGHERAAETGDGNVYLVNSYLAPTLDKDLSGWRSDQLAELYSPDVAAVTIATPQWHLALAHAGSLWTITAPVADLADHDRAEGLIGDLSGARIKEFVDNAPNPKALGLEPPRFAVTIVKRDAKAAPIVLAFGNERDAKGGKQVACQRGDRVFWVEGKTIAHLTAAWQDWRAKKLLGFDSWGVDSLMVEAGGAKTKVQRVNGLWKAGTADANADAVSRRLTALGDLQVEAFDLPRPMGAPLGHVKLSGAGFSDDATFYAGPTPARDVAIVAGRTGGLAVDAAKVAAVLADPAALTKPQPTPVPTPSAKATPAIKKK